MTGNHMRQLEIEKQWNDALFFLFDETVGITFCQIVTWYAKDLERLGTLLGHVAKNILLGVLPINRKLVDSIFYVLTYFSAYIFH